MNKREYLTSHLDDLLDDGIDHVMLINERGRVESAASKNEIQISKDKHEIFSMGFRLHQSLLQEFDDEFGSVERFVIFRKKAKIVSVPLGSQSLIFVMNNMCDHSPIIRKIETINESCSDMKEPDRVYAETIVYG
ncbi:MAG: hypothetical protein KGH88_03415 [Thaumarchaeota archaeon]|nr:hypothetical protein [Nitrososphaerota archaeon]